MKSSGFHLIELLIVLSIVSLLLSFALPSYNNHLIRARRLQAQTALLALASQLEAYFVLHQSYQGATLANLKLPEPVVANNHYQLGILEATDSQFSLEAKPQGTQAHDDARCGNLLLYSSGEKRVSGLADLHECWS